MDTAHNKVVVYVRVRPYAYDCEVDVDNGKAVKDGVKCIIQLRKVNTPEVGQKDSGGKTNQATLPNTVRVKNDADNTFQSFTFDGVFNSFVPKTVPSHATQSSIWNESGFGPTVLDKAFNGYNINIVAYGESGSGKSYTLNGPKQDAGIISRFVTDMFKRIDKEKGKGRGKARKFLTRFVVEVSMFEIYDENIVDLIDCDLTANVDSRKHGISAKQHPRHGLHIQGLTKTWVEDASTLNAVIDRCRQTQAILSRQHLHDHTRKHTIIEVNLLKIVENTETDIETDDDYYMNIDETASTIKFVDLAGSDRHGKLLNAEGDKMFDQTDINASIDSFQHMLKIVSQNNTVNAHKPLPVPFRNSLLTKILKDCYGGNAYTYTLGTIAPSNLNYLETINTLTLLSNVKFIRNRAVQNKNRTYKLIRGLKAEIIYLTNELKDVDKKLANEVDVNDGKKMLNRKDTADESKYGALTAEERAKQASDKREKILNLELYKSKLDIQMEEDLKWIDELDMLDEDKQKESSRRIQKQIDMLNSYGIVDGSISKAMSRTPYLVNLDKDSTNLSRRLAYLLPKGETTIGLKTNKSTNSCDVCIVGLNVDHEHCAIKNNKGELTLINGLQSKTYLNGKLVTLYDESNDSGDIPRKATPPKLNHNDRLVLGNDVVLLVQIPGMQTDDEDSLPYPTGIDWQYAIKELYRDQITKYTQVGLSSIEGFRKTIDELNEKMDNLGALINECKVQLLSTKGIAAEKLRTRRKQLQQRLEDELAIHKSETVKCDLYKRRFNKLLANLNVYLPLIQEGCSHLVTFEKKNLDFKIKVFDNDIYIELVQPTTSKNKSRVPIVWNHDKFLLRLHLMRRMYTEYMFTVDHNSGKRKSVSSLKLKYRKEKDPFSDFMQHQLLGRSLIYLDSLSYFLDFEDTVPLVNYRGERSGRMSIKLAPLSVDDINLQLNSIHDEGEKNIKDFLGQLFSFNIHIISAQSLPDDMCCNTYAQFKFPETMGFNQEDSEEQTKYFKTEACAHDTKNPIFPKSVFTVERKITPSFCDVLSKDVIEVEVYGAPSGSSIENHAIQSKQSSSIVNMSKEEIYKINMENLENSLLQERIMSEEKKIFIEDLGKQVEKLKSRIRNNGGNVGDDPSIKYQVENQDLRNRVQQMKEEIKLKEQKMKEMEASLLENKKSKGCLVQ